MKTQKYSEEELNEINHFDLHAERYDSNYNYTQGFTRYKILKKSQEFVSIVKCRRISGIRKGNIKILELGCGTGEYTSIIARMLPEANFYCVDISPRILKVARRKCKELKNVRFFTDTAYHTKFPRKHFDFVFGYYILHHLDLNRIANEIKRVLKDEGVGFFYEPNILNPYVFLVKSFPLLKRRVGDSPDEWAINPMTIKNFFSGYKSKVQFAEYIYPLTVIPLPVLILIDKLSFLFRFVPVLKYLSGSVSIEIRKNG